MYRLYIVRQVALCEGTSVESAVGPYLVTKGPLNASFHLSGVELAYGIWCTKCCHSLGMFQLLILHASEHILALFFDKHN